MRTLFAHVYSCPNCRQELSRVSKFDDPFALGQLDCGFCATKFTGDRCISTRLATQDVDADTDLLCASIIAAGALAKSGWFDTVATDACDVLRELKAALKK